MSAVVGSGVRSKEPPQPSRNVGSAFPVRWSYNPSGWPCWRLDARTAPVQQEATNDGPRGIETILASWWRRDGCPNPQPELVRDSARADCELAAKSEKHCRPHAGFASGDDAA